MFITYPKSYAKETPFFHGPFAQLSYIYIFACSPMTDPLDWYIYLHLFDIFGQRS